MTTTPRLRDDDPIPPGIIRRVSLGVIVVGIVGLYLVVFYVPTYTVAFLSLHEREQ